MLDVPFRKCGFARNPSKKEDMTLTFTESNSPYAFDNVLMLVVDGRDRRLVNSFFVGSITNILRDQTYEEEKERNCDGTKTGETVRIYKFHAANRFYINYDFNPRSNGAGTDRLKKGEAATVRTNARSKGARQYSDGVYSR